MKILVVDVGGTNVKLLVSGRRTPLKIPSGSRMTARAMVSKVLDATADWRYDVVSIGYPGVVSRGKIVVEPVNMGKGWVGFDFRKAFRRPVRLINDAAMQAFGSYRGGHMLFLGLGTGFGTAMVCDGVVVPMEIQHLPYHNGYDYEEYLGEAGMKRIGKRAWRRHVAKVTALFTAALGIDYVGTAGNTKHLSKLRGTTVGNTANAFKGGLRLWTRSEDQEIEQRVLDDTRRDDSSWRLRRNARRSQGGWHGSDEGTERQADRVIHGGSELRSGTTRDGVRAK